ARWRRSWKLPLLAVTCVVNISIANRFPFFIDEHQRLLKQTRRRSSFGHGTLENIKSRSVHVNGSEGARSVGIQQLEPMARDLIGVCIFIIRDLRVPLDKLPRRMHDRSLHITRPGASAFIAFSACFFALLGSRSVDLLRVRIIDDRNGVVAGALIGAVHMSR